MKKNMIAALLWIALGLVSWGAAQSGQPFDLRKSKQELEIMKGILETTLNFVVQEIRQRESSSKSGSLLGRFYGGGPDVRALYLPGQGALFMIATSGLSHRMWEVEVPEIDAEEMQLAAEDMSRAARELERGLREAGADRRGGGQVPPQLPQPPLPPQAAPAAPAAPAAAVAGTKPEDIRRRVSEAQEKVKQRREEMTARRKKLTEYVEEIKGHLIEALANHGDSLTTVKPGEYINIIINGDSSGGERFFPGEESDQPAYQVVSVPKSLIADYKAGKLTLDVFKQKVLQYRY
jgi:hypothetical protein